jgi:hypothetical protein
MMQKLIYEAQLSQNRLLYMMYVWLDRLIGLLLDPLPLLCQCCGILLGTLSSIRFCIWYALVTPLYVPPHISKLLNAELLEPLGSS